MTASVISSGCGLWCRLVWYKDSTTLIFPATPRVVGKIAGRCFGNPGNSLTDWYLGTYRLRTKIPSDQIDRCIKPTLFFLALANRVNFRYSGFGKRRNRPAKKNIRPFFFFFSQPPKTGILSGFEKVFTFFSATYWIVRLSDSEIQSIIRLHCRRDKYLLFLLK
jgi:hypothetical protein